MMELRRVAESKVKLNEIEIKFIDFIEGTRIRLKTPCAIASAFSSNSFFQERQMAQDRYETLQDRSNQRMLLLFLYIEYIGCTNGMETCTVVDFERGKSVPPR